MTERCVRSPSLRTPAAAVMAALVGACQRVVEPPDLLALAAASARLEEASGEIRSAPSPTGVVFFTRRDPAGSCPAAKATSCALDAVGDVQNADVSTVGRDVPVLLAGWAADLLRKQVPEVVIIELSGPEDITAPAARRGERKDVAATYGAENLAASGYVALASFLGVSAGEYVVSIRQIDAEGNATACDTHRRIVVRQ